MNEWKRFALGVGIVILIVVSAVSLSKLGGGRDGSDPDVHRSSDSFILSILQRQLLGGDSVPAKIPLLNVQSPIPLPTVQRTPTPTPTKRDDNVLTSNGHRNTPTPTHEIERVSENRTREELVKLVHETFPDDPYMGDVVVWRETLNYPDGVWQSYVYGDIVSTTGDCGLMQINWPIHHWRFTERGWTQQDCFNPLKNLIIAREIYNESGPSAWVTYY